MNTLRRVLAVAVTMAALVVPAELAAQRLAVWVMPRDAGSRLQGGAFSMLLNSAEALGLTRDQIRDIRRVREQLAESTERHAAQLRDAEVWGVDEADTAQVAALARVRLEVDSLTRGAEVEVEAVLSEEQRAQAREILQGGSLIGVTPGEVEPVEPAAGTPEDSARAESERTTVRVENQNFLDMSVFVYRSGQRYRLGSVTGLNSREFVIPSHFVFGLTAIRFQVDPVARSLSQLSDEVMVQPGDQVLLRIPPT